MQFIYVFQITTVFAAAEHLYFLYKNVLILLKNYAIIFISKLV